MQVKWSVRIPQNMGCPRGEVTTGTGFLSQRRLDFSEDTHTHTYSTWKHITSVVIGSPPPPPQSNGGFALFFFFPTVISGCAQDDAVRTEHLGMYG